MHGFAQLDRFDLELFFLQVKLAQLVIQLFDLVVFRLQLQLGFVELLDVSLVRAVAEVQRLDLGFQVVDRDFMLLFRAIDRIVVKLRLPDFVSELLVGLLEVADLDLGLLELDGA